MERPSWAPVILTGALPRELPDLLAVFTLILGSVEVSAGPLLKAGFHLGQLILVLMVPPICALAGLSITPTREKEELALIAYGGSDRQIHFRYFLRGTLCTAIGVSPFILDAMVSADFQFTTQIAVVTLALLIGGISYATPSLRRTRTPGFFERYKG